MNSKESIVELDKVSYVVNGQPILTDVSCAIERGSYTGIIGPNGGGKTTLLRLMLGLNTVTHGSAKLFGQRIQKFHDWTRVGYLSQRAAQVDLRFPVTVEEVVRQGRIGRIGLFKRFRSADYTAVDHAMQLADVTHLRDRLLENLSGGERQRVLIARALAGEPEILFLDEPLAGVDLASQERFYQFLKELNTDLGLTVVFVSHDIHELAKQVTQIICVNRTIVAAGAPKKVLQQEVLDQLYGGDHMVHHEEHHLASGSHQ